MSARPQLARDAAVGAIYFALATVAIATTRFDGGLAYLWLATPFLVTILLRRPRRHWAAPIAWSAAGGMLATGLFGVGWVMAPVLAIANMAEALVVAYLMRRARSSRVAFGSARWAALLFWAAGIAGPMVMVSIAAIPMWFHSGQHPSITILRVLAGHGLSNLTFIPIMKLWVTGSSGLWRQRSEAHSFIPILLLFAIQVVVIVAVFAQTRLPLLFLPILPVVAIAFRGDSRRSAISLLLLAAISGIATLLGRGPIQLSGVGRGQDMQFLQFYLLVTVLTIVPIVAELRSRARLVRRVRDSEARYRMLADHSGDIITHTDLHGNVLFVSPSITRIGGYEPRELNGKNILDLVDPRDQPMVRDRYVGAIVSGGEAIRFEFRARTKNGIWRWFESYCRGVVGKDDRVAGLVSIIRDISDRKEREEQLSIAAMTDPLTGLANRRAFREAALLNLADQRVHASAIALIDIDHFKSVNDRFGHDAGDEVLRSFGSVAKSLLRHNDLLARVGGEEFAILFPGLDQHGAAVVCDRIREMVARTVCKTAAGPVEITFSGGVVELGPDGIDEAIRRADLALYEAKSNGRDRLALAA